MKSPLLAAALVLAAATLLVGAFLANGGMPWLEARKAVARRGTAMTEPAGVPGVRFRLPKGWGAAAEAYRFSEAKALEVFISLGMYASLAGQQSAGKMSLVIVPHGADAALKPDWVPSAPIPGVSLSHYADRQRGLGAWIVTADDYYSQDQTDAMARALVESCERDEAVLNDLLAKLAR